MMSRLSAKTLLIEETTDSAYHSVGPAIATSSSTRKATVNHPQINTHTNVNKSTVHIGQSSMIKVLYNMLNALIGGGIVGIAYIYKESGIIGGCSLMLLFAVLCTYTLSLMVKCAKISGVHDYEKLCEHCFGISGYIIVSISLLLVDFGVCLTYFIILGDAAFLISSIWGFDTIFDRNLILCVIAIFIIFPTCVYRDISALEKLSKIKLYISLCVVAIVIYEWMTMSDAASNKIENLSLFINWNGIPESIGIIGYAFVCHDSAFLYYNTLIRPTMIRWTQLSFSAVFAAMLLSTVCGIFAYLSFGNDISSNMLNNYPKQNSVIVVVRIIYIIIMSWSYPTSFYMVRHIILAATQKICKGNGGGGSTEYTVHSLPWVMHISLTSFLFFMNLALAVFVRDLGSVMSIVGNLPSMNIAFVMPCLCYLKLHKHEFKCWQMETPKKRLSAWINVCASIILPICGIGIGIFGTINTVLQGI